MWGKFKAWVLLEEYVPKKSLKEEISEMQELVTSWDRRMKAQRTANETGMLFRRRS